MQYIYFEVFMGAKVLDAGMLQVNRYTKGNADDEKHIIEWLSEYIVPYCADPDTVERGLVNIRFREISKDEYDAFIKENERVMRGELQYG